MKKTIIRLLVILSIITAIYQSAELWKGIIWDSNKLIGIIVFMTVILVFVFATTILMAQKFRYKFYYVSFPLEIQDYVNKFREFNCISPLIGSDSLNPGNKMDRDIPQCIKRTSICIIIINKKIDAMQKKEISEMKKTHKRIIPIIIDNSIIPSSLSRIIPIRVSLENLPEVLIK